MDSDYISVRPVLAQPAPQHAPDSIPPSSDPLQPQVSSTRCNDPGQWFDPGSCMSVHVCDPAEKATDAPMSGRRGVHQNSCFAC